MAVKQNIQMDVSHADIAENGVAQGTQISLSASLYLHHLRHRVIAVVVQRTVSVSEVILEACQVNFMAYVKC